MRRTTEEILDSDEKQELNVVQMSVKKRTKPKEDESEKK